MLLFEIHAVKVLEGVFAVFSRDSSFVIALLWIIFASKLVYSACRLKKYIERSCGYSMQITERTKQSKQPALIGFKTRWGGGRVAAPES